MGWLVSLCFLVVVDGSDKYGKRVSVRCRYVTTHDKTSGIIDKARAIMSKHRLKKKQSLPDYFSPADLGAWRLAGHIGYES
jgi:hypothetical protein